MAEQTQAQAKLVQYLTEAYGKEKELESTLPLHIELNTRAPYKKRLQQHLRETKSHAKQLERRIKQISGSGVGTVSLATGQQLLGRAVPAVKGPLQALRGASDQEKLLKNAKTEYWNEHEEIATYTAIEALAEAVGDSDTAKLAKGIRREEQRMADFLARQIPVLTKAVAQAEIPASERKSSSRRRRRSPGSRAGGSRSASPTRKASSTRSKSSRSGTTRKASSTRSKSSRSGTTRKASSTRSKSGGRSSSGSSRGTRRRSSGGRRSS